MEQNPVINQSMAFFSFTESVKSILGRHTKILVKYMVKLETKGDKTENRVLVSMTSMLILAFINRTSNII